MQEHSFGTLLGYELNFGLDSEVVFHTNLRHFINSILFKVTPPPPHIVVSWGCHDNVLQIGGLK